MGWLRFLGIVGFLAFVGRIQAELPPRISYPTPLGECHPPLQDQAAVLGRTVEERVANVPHAVVAPEECLGRKDWSVAQQAQSLHWKKKTPT